MKVITLPIRGLDCAECAGHVKQALESVPGVAEVDVLLSSQKTRIRFDPAQTGLPAIRRAVELAGYSLELPETDGGAAAPLGAFGRRILTLFGAVFGIVLFVVVVGEWLGLFEAATQGVPWPAWLVIILLGGYPIFTKVVKAALGGRVISHTLMTLGVVAAVAVGEWPAADIVVFFMRLGE
ncbi:MAG: cation-translocating P-type ATPase, partial [Desulfuromonadales bacterium]|nr:cation-translocating P-type ATPase [Desulfuromonadales bacterium]